MREREPVPEPQPRRPLEAPQRTPPTSVAAIQALQRSAGNQAVGRMLARVIQIDGEARTPAQVTEDLEKLTPKPEITQANREWLRLSHAATKVYDFASINAVEEELKGTATKTTPEGKTRQGALTELPPANIKFSQITVSEDMSPTLDIPKLTEIMRTKGWDPDAEPIDVVDVPGMGIVSVDNRRIICARAAGLEKIPVRMHHFNDPLDIPGGRIADGFTLKFNVDLVGGKLVPKAKGRLKATKETVYAKGTVAATWGEAVLFRTVNQNELAPELQFLGRYEMYGRLTEPMRVTKEHKEEWRREREEKKNSKKKTAVVTTGEKEEDD
jgi:hypothetical protein